MKKSFVCLVIILTLDAGGALAFADEATEPVTLAQLALDRPASAEAEIEAEVDQRVFRFIPEKKSLALFLAAQALVIVDMGQTLDIRNHPEVEELNPILGREPSRDRVYAVFGSHLLINTLAYWLLPGRWANGLSMLSITIGIPVVANNASLGLSVAF